MVDYNLIKSLGVSDDDVAKQLDQAMGGSFNQEALGEMMMQVRTSPQVGSILTGKVVNVVGNDVVVEVGLKSEGTVDISEFESAEQMQPGQPVEVLLEEVESDSGLVVLSKRKADRIRGWENIVTTKKEGDPVSGKVTRKINISAQAFSEIAKAKIEKMGGTAQVV